MYSCVYRASSHNSTDSKPPSSFGHLLPEMAGSWWQLKSSCKLGNQMFRAPTGRRHFEQMADHRAITCGVPQGSVLGPHLFILSSMPSVV